MFNLLSINMSKIHVNSLCVVQHKHVHINVVVLHTCCKCTMSILWFDTAFSFKKYAIKQTEMVKSIKLSLHS